MAFNLACNVEALAKEWGVSPVEIMDTFTCEQFEIFTDAAVARLERERAASETKR